MKYPKYVQVSYDAPDEWWDPKSSLWFRKKDGIIELDPNINASNIIRYLRLNYLIDVTHLKEKKEKEPEKVSGVVNITPNQLLVADVQTLPPQDEKKVCPYCKKECSPRGIQTHIRYCKDNPVNLDASTNQEQNHEE